MRRILAFLLAVLFSLPVVSCAEQTGYQAEENTGRDKDSYPYVIRTPYAVWYLSKADIALLGEDAYYEGLYAILDDTMKVYMQFLMMQKRILPMPVRH